MMMIPQQLAHLLDQKKLFYNSVIAHSSKQLGDIPKLQSVIINWEPSTGQIAGYVIEIREKDGPQGKRFMLNKDSTTCDATQLKPDNCYEVSICAAYNELLTGEVDDHLSYTDISHCSELLQVTIVSCHSVHLGWSLPNMSSQPVSSCNIVLCCVQGRLHYMSTIGQRVFFLRQQFPSTVTSYDIISLSPIHCYIVQSCLLQLLHATNPLYHTMMITFV